jgi:uncharacterized protein
MKASRRRFLKTSAIAAGAVAMRPSAWAPRSTTIAMEAPLSLFGYAEVQLLEGPLREQFDNNHDLFLHLDEDALLKPFRQRQGMAAPGPDMGGWYDNSDDFNARDNFYVLFQGIVSGNIFLD